MALQQTSSSNKTTQFDDTPSMAQQMEIGREYQKALESVDIEVLQQFQKTIASLRMVLWFKAGMYLLQLVIVSIVLFWSLSFLLHSNQPSPWILGISLVSLLLLGVLSFRNPVQMINRVLVDLARIYIVLQGSAREFSQVDAAFRQALHDGHVDSKYLRQSAEHIQKITDGNIESLLQFMEDLHF